MAHLTGEVEDFILYNDIYQIFVCSLHGYAITHVDRHLRLEHEDISLPQRKQLVRNHQHQEALLWSAVRTPPSHSAPIPGLSLPVGAFRCQAPQCRFISTHIEGIKRHARQKHLWQSSQQSTFWAHVFAQTWFTAGGKRQYFEVRVSDNAPAPISTHGASAIRTAREPVDPTARPSASRIAPADARLPSRHTEEKLNELLADAETMDQEHEAKMQEMDQDLRKQDRTGWYSRTQWTEHFRGRNLQHLGHATRLPDRDEVFLVELVRVFDLFASQATSSIDTLHQELRRWLRSEQATTISPRPFGRLQNPESEDRYWGYFRRFVCYIFRVWQADQAYWQFGVKDEEDDEAGVALYDIPNHTSIPTHQDAPSHFIDNHHQFDEIQSDHNDSDDSDDSDDNDDDDDDDDTNTNADTPLPPIPAESMTPALTEEIDLMKDARELFPWNENQRDWAEKCCVYIPANEYVSDATRIQAIQGLLTSFICHEVGGEKFRSGLIHFTAVLGIDEQNRRLRQAVDFSYIIAGLVWDLRVLGAEILFPGGERAEQLKTPMLRQKFLRQRAQYLADGTGTPMSELINLLAYGKHVALNTSNAGSVIWSQDKQTMFFHGLAIPMTSFRAMVLHNVEQAETLLWEDLMWVRHRSERFTVDLDAIEDDLTFTRRGMSFLTRERNGFSGGREYMMRQMLGLKGKRSLQRRNGEWNLRNVRRYLSRDTSLLERLLFGKHSTYGQVGRGTEITFTRFRNGTLQDRNIYVADGSVFEVTRYHKSQALFDTPKVIARFLPWRVGQLFAIYLIYIQPFCEYLLKRTQNQEINDHIWHNERGPWETEQLTRIIKRETALGLGHRFNTLDFRHLVISIGREKVDPKFAVGYKDDVGEVEEPEQEYEDGLELQSGRGEAMGSSRYGVPSNIVQHLTVRSIETFRSLSEGWHRFLGLASTRRGMTAASDSFGDTTATSTLAPDRNKRPMRDSWEVPSTLPRWRSLFDRVGSSSVIPGISASAAGIEEALHRLFGDGSVGFRSREQEEGVVAVLQGESPVTIVLPTGGGKTLLAMLPISLETDGVSIFIAPFRALVDDVVVRFRRAGIDCIEWKAGEVNPARLVVVSADIAVHDNFMTYGRTLVEAKLLRRIFIDEGHCTFTDSHWRKNLSRVRRVRGLGCPIYILTATLPPQRVHELEDSLAIRCSRIIRASTIRPQHRYLVQHCRPGELQGEALRICQRQLYHLQQRQARGVVYSLSKTFCMELAQQLGCHHYHAGVHDRAERLTHWVQHGGFIVATSALGTGVDIPGIVFILHVDIPYSMIDFAQQSGRGGRGGEAVDSMILVPHRKAETRLQSGGLRAEDEVMAQFVAGTTCRRRVMSEYLDGATLARSCSDDATWLRCDRCGEGTHEMTARTREDEQTRQRVEEIMTVMTMGCVYCWIDGRNTSAGHSTTRCGRRWWGEQDVDRFRGRIRYGPDTHSCHRCGISQSLCATGQGQERDCQWPGVMAPVVFGAMQSGTGFEQIQRAGYLGGYQDWEAYGRWLGQRHFQRIWGENMSNGMMVLIRAIQCMSV